MTITIELAPEVEAQLRTVAAKRGQEPQGYLTQVLTDALQREREQTADDPNAAGAVTLDKMLAGRVGRINSGGSQIARNVEKEFGDYLEEKRRQRKL